MSMILYWIAKNERVSFSRQKLSACKMTITIEVLNCVRMHNVNRVQQWVNFWRWQNDSRKSQANLVQTLCHQSTLNSSEITALISICSGTFKFALVIMHSNWKSIEMNLNAFKVKIRVYIQIKYGVHSLVRPKKHPQFEHDFHSTDRTLQFMAVFISLQL